MGDDLLAGLRPPGGWNRTAEPVENAAQPPVTPSPVVQEPEAAQVTAAARADDERWLLACIARGHVRWRGDGTRRVAVRSCAHTDDHADVTDPVARLIAAGHAQRTGSSNQGAVKLTIDGRRRLADLERVLS